MTLPDIDFGSFVAGGISGVALVGAAYVLACLLLDDDAPAPAEETYD